MPQDAQQERRRAVVTGAANGIGAAVAARFLDDGWGVEAWDLCPADDSRLDWSTVDVADADSVNRAASTLESVDAVINCAAIATLDTILDIDSADWNRTLAINLTGSFNVARALYPGAATGGRDVDPLRIRQRPQHHDTSRRVQRIEGGRRVAHPDDRRRVGARRLRDPRALRLARPDEDRAGDDAHRVGSDRRGQAPRPCPDESMDHARGDRRRRSSASRASDFSAMHGANVVIDAGYDAWGGHF